MAALSYQEKSLYCALAAELLVYVPYFVHVTETPGHSAQSLIGTVILLIVVLVALEIVLAITTRQRRIDERDRMINARSCRIAYLALAFANPLIFAVLLGSHEFLTAGMVANALLGGLTAGYTVQLVAQLAMYRMAA